MIRFFLPFIALLMLLAACQKNSDMAAQPKTISDLVEETPTFSLLRSALVQVGLADALKGAQLTLFAPTDDAFRAAGYTTPDAFRNIPADQLRALLRYHLLAGAVSTQTPELASVTNIAVEGADRKLLYVTNGSSGFFVNGSRVTQADQVVANGYVHTINRVLTPPATNMVTALSSRSDLTLLTAAVTRAATIRPDLLTILNGTTTNASLRQLTVFAPSDAAFMAAGYRTTADINAASAATLANLLTCHVVPTYLFSNQLLPGQLTTLNSASNNKLTLSLVNNAIAIKGNRNSVNASIKQADLISGNAVIHIIDQVLLP